MTASSGTDAGGGTPPRASRRFTAVDAALIGGGALLTAAVAAAATRKPLSALALLAVLAFAAAVLFGRERLARTGAGNVLTALLVSLPLLALLGPSFALPLAPQAFLFRVVLAIVVYAGILYLLLRHDPMPFAAKDLLLPGVLWFAWLLLGTVWSEDKAAALHYISIVVTMVALLLATAAAGGTRRRLIWFGYSMIVGYAFVAGFTLIESGLGIRLPISRMIGLVTSQTYAVTSVFVNRNDLATYLAMVWPFMLCAFFFTRRPRWILLTLVFMLIGGYAFIHTGSRSSLLAAGISTLAAVALFRHLAPRLSSRSGKIVMGVVAVVLIAGGGWLLFNNSSSSMLRQFRLESLLAQIHQSKGSGAIRSDLTSRGLEIAGSTDLLGAGAGQAEIIIGSGTNALGIANLHNWWLETYADGGLVGFALQFVFFLLLVFALWPIARHDPDPLNRYLASGTWLALLGWTIGALGPSSSVSFAPMWILYGLALAVVSRARLAALECAPEVKAADGSGPVADDAGGAAGGAA